MAANKGYFIQPTVFGDVQDNMTIAREEVGKGGHCQPSWWRPCDLSPLGRGMSSTDLVFPPFSAADFRPSDADLEVQVTGGGGGTGQ